MRYGVLSDLLLILGAIAIVAGIGSIYRPAAFIASGLFLIAGGIAVGRAEPAGDKR